MKKLLLFFPLFAFAAHVFVLHRIDDFKHPYTNTSSKELNKYITYLKNHNYKIITLSKLANLIKNRQNTDKYVVFCIDDSYKSFYKNGLRVFKKHKVPFTLFVYVKATNEKWGDFMSWDELKKVAKYGELGIHSFAHPHLPKLSNEEIIKDTKKANEIFKKHMGYVPNMYAYPYGEYDKRVKKIISQFFDIVANQNPGAVDNTTPLNDIDRIALTGKVDISKKLKLKRLHADINITRDKNTIKQISAKIYDNIPYVNIYITDYGWEFHVPVKNSYVHFKPNFTLKRYRNRVIIRYNYKINSQMIVKY